MLPSAHSYNSERSNAYAAEEEEDAEEPTDVDQQARLPDAVRDPKLYLVKCKLGKERETVICLMQKAKTLADQSADGTTAAAGFLLKSASCQDHLKGYIYVEAERKPHVRMALKGLRNIYGSFEPQLVPIKEMVASVSVTLKAAAAITVGSWIRMRAGVYKGDLGRVLALSVDENTTVVRLVPRLDYTALHEGRASAKPVADPNADPSAPKKRAPRPPARLFSHADAQLHGVTVEERRDKTGLLGTYLLVGSQLRIKDGYLVRNSALSSCRHEPAPPFDELQKFSAAEAADSAAALAKGASAGVAVTQLAALASAIPGGGAGGIAGGAPVFAPGDGVIVVAPGDLKNLTGTVEAVLADGEVRVVPRHEELAGAILSFKASDLAKHFTAGAHVRVTLGKHEGATGMVLSTDNDVAVLLTDILREEIKVFMRDLVDAADATSGDAMLGEYAMFDLALLADGVAGVVVQVERDACVVLTHNGTPDRPELRTCRVADLTRKLNPVRNSAMDVNSNAIARGDAVRISDGPSAGKSGVVQWAHRGYLFIKSREVIENAGVLCVRSKAVKVAGGARSGGAAGPSSGALALAHASPALVMRSPALHQGAPGAHHMSVPQSPRLAPGAGPLAPFGGPSSSQHRAPMAPGSFSGGRGGRRDDMLVGQRVLVRSGAYKGYRGVVLDATEAVVRLELEANEKTVTINRVHVDPAGAAALPSRAAEAPTSGYGGATPRRDVYGRTPVHLGNATPMRDPTMTPSREVFGATPARSNAWDLGPSRGGTPARDSGFGGHLAAPSATSSGWVVPVAPHHMASSAMATPVSGTPSTPHFESLHAPGIGGSAASFIGGPSLPPWIMQGLLVKLRESGTVAVVRSVAPDSRCLVSVRGAEMSVLAAGLLAQHPAQRDDRVRVVAGEGRGTAGRVTMVDGGDAFVRFDDGGGNMYKVHDLCLAE